jgi:hypothetical protein
MAEQPAQFRQNVERTLRGGVRYVVIMVFLLSSAS